MKQIIEFYYVWKKTGHYKQWKQQYIPDDRVLPHLVDSSVVPGADELGPRDSTAGSEALFEISV